MARFLHMLAIRPLVRVPAAPDDVGMTLLHRAWRVAATALGLGARKPLP
ncbi:hypothetical protein ACFQ16_22290 [Saccharopolyspora rosea]|uniref:Uncharacterized protein n=1 Tax=Saccharopolyspora rosea TaxID=524884 RepID=A0ABW3G0R7_9PSEU